MNRILLFLFIGLFISGLFSCSKDDTLPENIDEISEISTSNEIENRTATWKWTKKTNESRQRLGVCGAKWWQYGTQVKCYKMFNCSGVSDQGSSWRCSCECNKK
ncbi:MAG TPA: hypothetical protein PKD51_17575 [Saprospiraceae bacterium]|nr:hypothetical protein [Saprospiraceae bacterium]HMU02746.1 hypothetical protein [Saprospiraceae bacterium]